MGDFDRDPAIFIFGMDGSFRQCIRRPGAGPGEYERFDDFAVLSDGSLVLSCWNKVVKLAPDGRFLAEASIASMGYADQITAWNNRLMLYMLRTVAKESGHAVFGLSADLAPVNHMHPHDPRKDIYLYTNHDRFAVLKDNLWVSEMYRPTLSVYAADGTRTAQYVFPQKNAAELEDQWQAQPFREENRTAIKNLMHRFMGMRVYRDGLLLFSFTQKPETDYRMMRFTPPGKLVVYSGYHPHNRAYADREPNFHTVCGQEGEPLVGVLTPEGGTPKVTAGIPNLAGLTFADDDNLALVFFDLKQ